MSRELIRTADAWNKVKIARDPNRPNAKFYINEIFDEFIELHGDRNFGDDKAIIGGIALLNNLSFTVIGICKGENTKENIKRNFGMPHPEGYRKALRLMKQAEKFKRPVICFVDTPGAFCGIGAEERGQGQAIAVADKVFMLEHSIYSVLSPEGFASILWKDSSRAEEAASVMKITAQDLKSFNIIDKIIKEPRGGAHKNPIKMAQNIKKTILEALGEMKGTDLDTLLNERYNKYRNIENNL